MYNVVRPRRRPWHTKRVVIARKGTTLGRSNTTDANAPKDNLNRGAITWNAIGSITSAAQSFVFLTAVTRVLGADAAGDYSIGIAIAQLMWTIGLFDQTSYLVTDSENRFTLEQYYAFKLLSCLAMVIGSVVYTWTFHFATEKALLALALCALKLVDAYCSYYHSAFQKLNRLDISGFALFVENLSAMVVFVPALLLTRNLLGSVVAATVVMFVCTIAVYRSHMPAVLTLGKPDFTPSKLVEQFMQLLPLFVANFLYGYLANVPRYAIEAMGTSAMQATFSVLFMPSFAISLCVRFILKPSTTSLATLWADGDIRGFLKLIVRLLLGDLGVTLAFMLGAWLLGIPVLQLVFGLDLTGYATILVLLLFASGVMVASDVLFYPIVIFRKQMGTVVAYALALGAGTLVSNQLVGTLGISGAALCYLVEAVTVCVVFLGIIALTLTKRATTTR